MADFYEEMAALAVTHANASRGQHRDYYEELASELVSKANEARTAGT